MAKPKIRLNPAGVRALLKDPGVESDLMRRGEQVASQGRATAPVATGEYRDGIEVTAHQGPTRVTVRIGSTSDHAAVVEAKTGNLIRALDAAGGA